MPVSNATIGEACVLRDMQRLRGQRPPLLVLRFGMLEGEAELRQGDLQFSDWESVWRSSCVMRVDRTDRNPMYAASGLIVPHRYHG